MGGEPERSVTSGARLPGRMITGRMGASRMGASRGLAARARTAGVLAAGALLVGCRAPEPTGGAERRLTTGEFIEVVTALREAEREVAREDSAEALFAGRKAEILSRYEVTEEDLREFLAAHVERPARLQEIWDTISRRLTFVPGEEGEEEPGTDAEPEFDAPSVAPGRRPGPSLGPPGPRPLLPGGRPAPDTLDGGGGAGEQRLH